MTGAACGTAAKRDGPIAGQGAYLAVIGPLARGMDTQPRAFGGYSNICGRAAVVGILR